MSMAGLVVFFFDGLTATPPSCASSNSLQNSFPSNNLNLLFKDQSPSTTEFNLENMNTFTQIKARCDSSLSLNEEDFQPQPSQTKPKKRPSIRQPSHPKLLKVSP